MAAYVPLIHVDLGSGDGRGPYRLARRDPERLYVAVDPNSDSLRRVAWRAARRPERGGVANLLCVAASASEVARELPAVADRLTVVLPWGGLLQGVATGEPSTLESIAALCQPSATVEIVFSYDPARDSQPIRVPAPATSAGAARLREAYRSAGLREVRVEKLDEHALLAYPTTWARRLAHGRARTVWRVRAVRSRAPRAD